MSPIPVATRSEHQRPLQQQPRPLEWRAPASRLPKLLGECRPDEDQRQGDQNDHRHAEREADGDESDLPPRPSLFDVVGAVERPDDRDERRGTAPQRTRDTEREQSAVLVVGEPSHLLLDQFEDLRRDERAEGATDIVGDVRERKEARECEQKQDRRKQREKEVVRQLSRETEHIVIDDLPPRATRELRPREGYRLEHKTANCKC